MDTGNPFADFVKQFKYVRVSTCTLTEALPAYLLETLVRVIGQPGLRVAGVLCPEGSVAYGQPGHYLLRDRAFEGPITVQVHVPLPVPKRATPPGQCTGADVWEEAQKDKVVEQRTLILGGSEPTIHTFETLARVHATFEVSVAGVPGSAGRWYYAAPGQDVRLLSGAGPCFIAYDVLLEG